MTLQEQRKAAEVQTLRKTVEDQKPQEMLAWVKAYRHFHMFETHGDPPTLRRIFATEAPFSYKWKEQAGEEDQRVQYMPLEAGAGHAGR